MSMGFMSEINLGYAMLCYANSPGITQKLCTYCIC